MPEVASIARVTQIGPETTPGTAVAALNQLRSLSFGLKIEAEVSQFKADGSLLAAVTAIGKEWASFPITGKATYEELAILFDSLLYKASVTDLGGTPNAYSRTWNQLANTLYDPLTYSIQRGSRARAMKATYGIITEMALAMTRTSIDITGAGMAQAVTDGIQMSTNEVQRVTITGTPTGGTFTLTYAGQTTANIAYNAAASAVQSALEALSNIGTGNVVCTGGALPGAAVDVEFRGPLRQTNVASMTANSGGLTGGSTPTVAISTPTPGVTPTALSLTPILPKHVGIWADTTSGGLGSTRLSRVVAANFSVAGRYGSVWPLDETQASFAATLETDPTFQLKLTAAADSAGNALLDVLRLGSTQFIRIRATGPLISGSNYNRLTVDGAFQVSAAPADGDKDGLYTNEWTLVPIDEPTWGKGFSVELISKFAALT